MFARDETFQFSSARRALPALLWIAVLLGPLSAPARGQDTLIPTGATWRYLDDGSDQGSAWADPAFDDSSWAAGPAQLGYGDGDEATVVSFGPDSGNKYITTYFRHDFTVANPGAYGSLDLGIQRDDGAVVYLNGTEVFRTSMPSGAIDYLTFAFDAGSESTFFQTTVSPGLLVAGTNVLAVEIHQVGAGSSDISFDLELLANAGSGTVNVTRGPYLQRATPTSLVVRWRTDAASDSRVSYGDAPTNLTGFADDPAVTTEHEVEVTGLLPDTTYFYAVGTTSEIVAGANASTFFLTPPPVGVAKPTRIWVIGDSGRANADARAVRDAYLGFAGGQTTDLWLMLGDNAYGEGTDAQHQAAIFDTYPSLLLQTVLWPTLGNHDAANADSATQTGPYYDIFTLPTAGEAGGFPSGTEAYYSFDYGNLHFVVLDSHDTDRSPGGAMMSWLAADVAATAADWVIAYWHHPPYSKGSHDSDFEGRLIDMRENALPVLEDAGVDLVLAGHSHGYERSFLLDSHYGDSSSLTGAMILDGGDGRPAGSGAYQKPTLGSAPHEGAVYVVAGNGSQLGPGSLDHPAMFFSLSRLGSVVLDVNGGVLDAISLDETGAVNDSFTLVKGGGGPPPCGPITPITFGSVWRYLDDGSNQGTAWRAAGFDDTGWASGPAELGYGDGDEATVVSFGPDPNDKHVTTYFRRDFAVADAAAVQSLTLGLVRDDGAVAYLNGAEVFRSNMPGGAIAFDTLASGSGGGLPEDTVWETSVDPAFLLSGTNVLAVEIHQGSASSSDISFDLELTGDDCGGGPGNSAPTVSITSPADGATVSTAGPVTLTATASDSEDGDLGAAVSWTDNGVPFATGASVQRTFTAGSHTIAASVTDSGGLGASDSITLTAQDPPAAGCLFSAGFDTGSDSFSFVDDPQTPLYAAGSSGSGALLVTVGGIDGVTVLDMTGAWQRTCDNDAPRAVTVTVQVDLSQAANYEADEISEVRLVVNGSTSVLATLTGDGNGGTAQTTGTQSYAVAASLPAGTNTFAVECFNNKKTFTDESTTCSVDSVTVAEAPPPADDCLFTADFAAGSDGFTFVDDPQTPAYASGSSGGGSLQVTVGGVDGADILDMTGAWQRGCDSSIARTVTVTVDAEMILAANYEADEFSEVRLVVNGTTSVLATLTGDGNGGVDQTTGPQTWVVGASLTAGANTVAVECFNNKKTFTDESTACAVTGVAVSE